MSPSAPLLPFRLAPWFSPRPWGTRDLSPWYSAVPNEPIGEAWLTGDQCEITTGPLRGKKLKEVAAAHAVELTGSPEQRDYPLLLKILFPKDKLSVQVHPDDAHAVEIGELRGKTECWYVLSADPGAYVSLGLKAGTTVESVRAAVGDNTLEDMLEKVPVSPGDMVFVDAGTVHAIGPGSILLETQQNSDVTFRMYDYGRPRELHLEPALKATRLQTQAGKVKPTSIDGGVRLIAQQYFIVDRLEVGAGKALEQRNVAGTPHALVALSGDATLHTDGAEPVELRVGEAVVVPACIGQYTIRGVADSAVLRSMPPTLQAPPPRLQDAS